MGGLPKLRSEVHQCLNPLQIRQKPTRFPSTRISTPKKLHEAANHYLNPKSLKNANTIPRKPSTIFVIAPEVDTEALLANACESMASASVMLSDFVALFEGPHRTQRVVMLGELAVNRALDNIDPEK